MTVKVLTYQEQKTKLQSLLHTKFILPFYSDFFFSFLRATAQISMFYVWTLMLFFLWFPYFLPVFMVYSGQLIIIVITRFQLEKGIHVLIELVTTACKLEIFRELLLVTRDHCTTWPLQIHLDIDSVAIEKQNSQSEDVNSFHVTSCHLEIVNFMPWTQH